MAETILTLWDVTVTAQALELAIERADNTALDASEISNLSARHAALQAALKQITHYQNEETTHADAR